MSKRKTVRPGVSEISPVQKRSDLWWQWWWWQCGSDLCRVVRREKTRMWMRLTERMRESIPKVGCCMLSVQINEQHSVLWQVAK